jgi:hypothetical protein
MPGTIMRASMSVVPPGVNATTRPDRLHGEFLLRLQRAGRGDRHAYRDQQ